MPAPEQVGRASRPPAGCWPGQRVGVDDPLHVGEAPAELAPDVRQRDVHDRHVQEQHEGRETGRQQGPPLARHGPRVSRKDPLYAYHPWQCSEDRSIQLGRVFGIRIGVDVSWFFVLFLIIWSLSGLLQRPLPGPGHEGVRARGGRRRCCSSSRSCSTSSATRSSRSATASRSSGSTCGCSAAWRSWAATPTRRASSSASPWPGRSSRSRSRRSASGSGRRCRAPHTLLEGSRFETANLSGHGRRARLPETVNLFVLRLQPDPRLPARRRADRAGDRLEADRRPQPRHPLRRPARPPRRLGHGRLRRADPGRRHRLGLDHRRSG